MTDLNCDSVRAPELTAADADWRQRVTHIDGCPNCVVNSEPPRSTVPTENGVRCAYICTDCGHVWTTDYRAENPCGVGVLSANRGGERGTIGAQIKTAPGGARTPLIRGLPITQAKDVTG